MLILSLIILSLTSERFTLISRKRFFFKYCTSYYGSNILLQEALFDGASLVTQFTTRWQEVSLISTSHNSYTRGTTMIPPITAAMLERFQNLHKSSWPN